MNTEAKTTEDGSPMPGGPEPMPQETPAPRALAGAKITAPRAAAGARDRLTEMVELELDSISEISKTAEGWRVVVNLVELRRIPNTTDVIASYEVLLDQNGDLLGYHRERRYRRDQTGGEV